MKKCVLGFLILLSLRNRELIMIADTSTNFWKKLEFLFRWTPHFTRQCSCASCGVFRLFFFCFLFVCFFLVQSLSPGCFIYLLKKNGPPVNPFFSFLPGKNALKKCFPNEKFIQTYIDKKQEQKKDLILWTWKFSLSSFLVLFRNQKCMQNNRLKDYIWYVKIEAFNSGLLGQLPIPICNSLEHGATLCFSAKLNPSWNSHDEVLI